MLGDFDIGQKSGKTCWENSILVRNSGKTCWETKPWWGL